METQGRTARGPSRRGPGVSVATEMERPRQEPGQCPRPVSLETGHSPRRPLTSAWCPGCAGRQSRDRGRAGLRGRGLGRGVSNGVGVGEGVPGRSKHRESLPPLSLSHDRWNGRSFSEPGVYWPIARLPAGSRAMAPLWLPAPAWNAGKRLLSLAFWRVVCPAPASGAACN